MPSSTRHRRTGALSVTLALIPFVLFGQASEKSQSPPETPRQALIKILTGDSKVLFAHLTREVQAFASSNEKGRVWQANGFPNLAGEKNVKVPETGPVLFSFPAPELNARLEVRVDSDDLSGEEDTMEISIHVVDDQQDDWVYPIPSKLVIALKREDRIWRLNQLTFVGTYPIGDASFLEAVSKRFSYNKTPSSSSSPSEITQDNTPAPDPTPDLVLRSLPFAERNFARMHPETGFTCSLADLVEASENSGPQLDSRIATGTIGGYKFSLVGCQGHPAASFQAVAEPAGSASRKAFCIDATENLRSAIDGDGTTCIANGGFE